MGTRWSTRRRKASKASRGLRDCVYVRMRRSNTCGCGVGEEARREETISRREAPRRRDMRRRRDWHWEARPAAAAAVAAAARVAVEGLAPTPVRSTARVPADRPLAAVAVESRARRRGIAISGGEKRWTTDWTRVDCSLRFGRKLDRSYQTWAASSPFRKKAPSECHHETQHIC